MKHSLTIAYVTARKDPKLSWFYASLVNQILPGEHVAVAVIDYYADTNAWMASDDGFNLAVHDDKIIVQKYRPKPSIWKGSSRLTKQDWWSKSNDLNTAICLCKTEWIAFVDDRSVLGPGWLDAVRRAMEGYDNGGSPYAVCGSYEKHAGLIVDNGEVKGSESLLGADTRTPGCYPFDSYYGGSGALPLEWCLAVQGFAELTDGLGLEDSMFGVTLRNSGYPIRYDSEMRIIEDRTPGQIDGALKRADKDVHLGQGAKSWAIVRALEGKTTSQNPFDIRNMRERVLAGEPFPPPTGSHLDWFDQQPLSEME